MVGVCHDPEMQALWLRAAQSNCAPKERGFSVGVVEMWSPCLWVSLRLGRTVTNLRRGWGRKVWVCCYLCKHPDSSSNSEDTSGPQKLRKYRQLGRANSCGITGEEVELVTAWERDTDASLELAPSPRLCPSDGEEEGREAGRARCLWVCSCPPEMLSWGRLTGKQYRAHDRDETGLSRFGAVQELG